MARKLYALDGGVTQPGSASRGRKSGGNVWVPLFGVELWPRENQGFVASGKMDPIDHGSGW